MNSAPYLLTEDRAEYERILDDALRDAPQRPELAAVGQRLNAEQLRSMALNATALITSSAAAEYAHYVRVREVSGTPSAATDRHAPEGLGRRFGAAVLGTGQPRGRRTGNGVAPRRWGSMSYGRRLLAAVLGLRVRPEAPTGARTPRASERPSRVRTPAQPHPGGPRELPPGLTDEPAGVGMFAVLLVLVPVLTGTASALFFLVGLVLNLFHTGSALARPMIAAGWLFGAVTVGGIALGVAGLVVTALRHRDLPARSAEAHRESEELRRARDAWRNAVLERGIMPFLRDALADPGTAPSRRDPGSPPLGRVPALGYNRPDFHPPGDGPGPTPPPRPSFSSPDFTNPDFGGPEPHSD
nr:hypothetical protein [Streptomyces sp.]